VSPRSSRIRGPNERQQDVLRTGIGSNAFWQERVGHYPVKVGEGFCRDCEREQPHHYDNCPKHANNTGDFAAAGGAKK